MDYINIANLEYKINCLSRSRNLYGKVTVRMDKPKFHIFINSDVGCLAIIDIIGQTISTKNPLILDVNNLITSFITSYIDNPFGFDNPDLDTLYYDPSFYNYEAIEKIQEASIKLRSDIEKKYDKKRKL